MMAMLTKTTLTGIMDERRTVMMSSGRQRDKVHIFDDEDEELMNEDTAPVLRRR